MLGRRNQPLRVPLTVFHVYKLLYGVRFQNSDYSRAEGSGNEKRAGRSLLEHWPVPFPDGGSYLCCSHRLHLNSRTAPASLSLPV